MSYKPRRGSVPDRVIAHLREHPDTPLSSATISALLCTQAENVATKLAGAVAGGALSKYRDDTGRFWYSLPAAEAPLPHRMAAQGDESGADDAQGQGEDENAPEPEFEACMFLDGHVRLFNAEIDEQGQVVLWPEQAAQLARLLIAHPGV